MTILERFDADPRFSRLSRRRNNFRMMVEHVLKFSDTHELAHIIETGSAWDLDNWEGQGQSTLIWDWLIENCTDRGIHAYSIDITPASVENSQKQTSHVEYRCADSVITLNVADVSHCGLLYLDSYDWTSEKNLESSFHHMAELATVWAKLPKGCMIVVDDRHGDMKGKHWMVEAFLSEYLKIKPVFRNHQIGWIKP